MAGKKRGSLFGLFGGKKDVAVDDGWEDMMEDDNMTEAPPEPEKFKPQDSPDLKENKSVSDNNNVPDIPDKIQKFMDDDDEIEEFNHETFQQPEPPGVLDSSRQENPVIAEENDELSDSAEAMEEFKALIVNCFRTADPNKAVQVKFGKVVLGILQYRRFTRKDGIPEEDLPFQDRVVSIIDELSAEVEDEEQTVITSSTTIVGNLVSDNTFVVAGSVSGNMETKADMLVSGMIVGDIDAENIVFTTGKIKGDILCRDSVSLEPEAVVSGNINAKDVVISGSVEGDIDARGTVTLTHTAMAVGDIKAKNIVIHDGAIFYGQCHQDYCTEIDIRASLKKMQSIFADMLPAIEDKMNQNSSSPGMEDYNNVVPVDNGTPQDDIEAGNPPNAPFTASVNDPGSLFPSQDEYNPIKEEDSTIKDLSEELLMRSSGDSERTVDEKKDQDPDTLASGKAEKPNNGERVNPLRDIIG